MTPTVKRVILGIVSGTVMDLAIWLFNSEASPVREFLADYPGAGYGLHIAILPALSLSRALTGTALALPFLFAAVFLQWLAIGYVIGSSIWPKSDDRA